MDSDGIEPRAVVAVLPGPKYRGKDCCRLITATSCGREQIGAEVSLILGVPVPAGSNGESQPTVANVARQPKGSLVICSASPVSLIQGTFDNGVHMKSGSYLWPTTKPHAHRASPAPLDASTGAQRSTDAAPSAIDDKSRPMHAHPRCVHGAAHPNDAEIFSTAVAKHVAVAAQRCTHAPSRGAARACKVTPAPASRNAAHLGGIHGPLNFTGAAPKVTDAPGSARAPAGLSGADAPQPPAPVSPTTTGCPKRARAPQTSD